MIGKLEILDYITNHNREFGGSLATERGFKKHFPEMYKEMCETKFPPFFDEFDFKQKLWHFLRDDYQQHMCKCGGLLKFRSFWYGYNEFCRMNCPSMVKNQVECITKIHHSRTPEEKKKIQEKVRQTFVDRYGVERYSQLDEWKEKTLKKNREKFGTDWYTQTEEYKQNYEQHCEEKYGEGIKNSFQDPHVKEKILEKFYKNFLKRHPNVIEIREKTLLCKCTDENCTLCKERVYEIDKVRFSGRTYSNIDTCTIRTPGGDLTSGVENELFDFISSIYGEEIIRNDRTVLKGKELDIYIPNLNLAFEFNGIYWHGEFNKDKMYHQSKSLECLSKNIQLIHVWEDDWSNKKDLVKEFIKSRIIKNDECLNCVVKEIDEISGYDFLQEHHIYGGIKNRKHLGAFYNDELVGVLSFTETKKTGYFEIQRIFVQNDDMFNSMLKYFEETYKPLEISVNINLDILDVKMYEQYGFVRTNVLKPTCTWVVNGVRKLKSNFSKSKLVECGINPELNEIDVMHNRGCWRCWDSGRIKLVLRCS